MDGRSGSPGLSREDRALQVVEDHAGIVRTIFGRYLEAGTVVGLKQSLDLDGVRIPQRIDGAGRTRGGGSFSRGHLYNILSNPLYVGEIAHKGKNHAGLHDPIVNRDLWDEVQGTLARHRTGVRTRIASNASEALLAGKLFDDRGNRMSPVWARKGSKRWGYYVSQAVLQGDGGNAGSIARVPAAEIEARVIDALNCPSPTKVADAPVALERFAHPKDSPQGLALTRAPTPTRDFQTPSASNVPHPALTPERRDELRDRIDRVTVSRTSIAIVVSPREGEANEDEARMLTIRWAPPSPYRRREIVQGAGDAPIAARPMRVEARRVLISALRSAHRWLDALIDDPKLTPATLAAREGRTERSLMMALSLAFLAPAIVKAAIEGRLPRGIGLVRLMWLPLAWSEQWRVLGLRQPKAG